MRTSSRNLAVLLFDEVELWDVAAVMHVASMAGRHWNWRPFRLLPTAERSGLIATRSQLRLEASHGLADCPEPEILFVPGGYGARLAAKNAAITDWCARIWPRLTLALTLGTGAAVLGAAGVLGDAEVAVSAENRDWLLGEFPGARWTEENGVVRSSSGKLLSVASGAHSLELGLGLVESCLGARLARTLRTNLGLAEAATRIDVGPLPLETPGRRQG